LPTNCPLSGQPISNEAVIGNSCRDWQLTSLSCGHAPSQFVEEVLEADYLAFLLGRFRGFHGVTGRAMRCSMGKSDRDIEALRLETGKSVGDGLDARIGSEWIAFPVEDLPAAPRPMA
jgi:hypothetical protein